MISGHFEEPVVLCTHQYFRSRSKPSAAHLSPPRPAHGGLGRAPARGTREAWQAEPSQRWTLLEEKLEEVEEEHVMAP